MERIAIVENDKIVNVVNAPADWVDPDGRELVYAPRGAGVEIGAERQSDGSWKMPEPPVEKVARSVRYQRDQLLDDSDWTQVPDAPVDHQAWAEYRQALRDLPQQEGFPQEITWPQKP
jgi:hypothetical protein